MAQPECKSLMNWLSSVGVLELSSVQNLQTNERIVKGQSIAFDVFSYQ